MRIIPSDVVTAHADSFMLPTKYRLSKTFAGSAYHSDRGGIVREAAAAAGAALAGAEGRGASHIESKTYVKSCPGRYATDLAADRWVFAADVCPFASTGSQAAGTTANSRNARQRFILFLLE